MKLMFEKFRMRKTAILVLGVALSLNALAGGGGLTGGATELTQIANSAELGAIIRNEAQQVSNQITQINRQIQEYQQLVNQYNNMLTNTLQLPSHIWGQAETALQNLANVVQTGEALAYSMTNLDTEFRNKYQSYDDHLLRDYDRTNFPAEYREWSDTNRDSIRSALLSANLQADQFSTENSTLQQIQALSQSSTGRLQAIQAGSLISAQQVRQIQKLRQLIMSQIQMQASAAASVQEEKDRNQAINDDYYLSPTNVTPNDGARY